MLKIKFIIPTANTHPNDAKWQHLVPRTYMRAWSYNQTNSVYVVMKNRLEEGIQPKNVETLNYKVGFHDIKAGDLFVPDEALNDLYGFMMDYDVLCGNIKLQKLRDFDNHYKDYDDWIIKDANGTLAKPKDKKEIKRVISQSRYTFIEKEWCRQYEDNWNNYINQIESKLRCKVFSKPYIISEQERRELMEYIIIFDFRSLYGNIWINKIIDNILPRKIARYVIPNEDRIRKYNTTFEEQIKHAVKIKSYYEFLKNKSGKLAIMVDNYLKSLGLAVYLTTDKYPFVTCETPSMIISRKDKLKEHIFVATPTMLITTFKTDRPERHFIKKYLSVTEVTQYNKYIANQSQCIITNKCDLDYMSLYK